MTSISSKYSSEARQKAINTPLSSTKPLPRKSLVETEELLGEDLFLYDDSTGAIHTLNSGAAIVWLLCDGSHDLSQISQNIASTTDSSWEQVLPQVEQAVSQFHDLGLLED